MRSLPLAVALLLPAVASAQGTVVTIQEQQLAPPTLLQNLRHARHVALSGDTVVIGREHLGAQPGALSAPVYVFDGSSWSLQDELVGSDTTGGDRFAGSVDIDGDTVVVGAVFESELGPGAGAAYVFVRSGTTWSQQAKLLGSDVATNDQFGHAVGIDRDTIVVTAPLDDDAAFDGGVAYVFVRSGTTWSEEAKLVPLDPSAGERLGWRVDIDEDTVTLSGQSFSEPYVYFRTGTSWSLQQKILLGGSGSWHKWGLAVDGNTLLATYFQQPNITGVHAFERTAGVWTLTDSVPNLVLTEDLGWEIELEGDTAAVAAPASLCGDGGNAYIFTRTGSDWTPAWKFTSADSFPFDRFGSDVAIDGGTVVAGASNDDVGGVQESGSAYVFSLQPGFPGSSSCFGTACPCGNDDPLPLDRGCVTSRGVGAELFATGTSSVSADDLVLRVADIPTPNANGLIFMGFTLLPPFAPSSADGYACTGGALRFSGILDDNVPPDELVQPNVVSTAAALGSPILPGCVRHFQAWFRDNNGSPCGGASNLSNAYTVSFNP